MLFKLTFRVVSVATRQVELLFMSLRPLPLSHVVRGDDHEFVLNVHKTRVGWRSHMEVEVGKLSEARLYHTVGVA